MSETESLLRVGVTTLVLKDGRVLLGQRHPDVMGGMMFQGPGGYLEVGESIIQCGLREIQEETGIEVENIRFACVRNVTDFLPKHRVMICLIADWKSGEPIVCEPDKCLDWDWYDLDALPQTLTPGTDAAIRALQTNQSFFDSDIIV